MEKSGLAYKWATIEKELDSLRKVSGGFSRAKRGLITLPDGKELFVKIGLHKNTKEWAKKEIWVYNFLKKHNFQHTPRLLSVNPDETGFAIEALTAKNGWDWRESWDQERLSATLAAMDDLSAISPQKHEVKFLTEKSISENDDGWRRFTDSPKRQRSILKKLNVAGGEELAKDLDFAEEAKRSAQYKFDGNTLVHDDIRSDNCAWNKNLKQVKIVDWNWIQLGDRDIDLGATLTHVQRSGFNLPRKLINTLNTDSLHWLAGFWLNKAITPIWKGGPGHLREIQLHAGIIALKLSRGHM